MRTVFALFLILAQVAGMQAANEKTVKANLQRVTVFRQGAQLYYSEPVTLQPGQTDVIFEGLSSSIDAGTLQAEGKGNFTILDVQYRKFLKQAPLPKNSVIEKQIRQLTDSIEQISFRHEDITNRKDVLNTEKSLLLANRIIKGDTKKDSLDLVKASMEYLRVRLNNINAELLKVKREEKQVLEEKNKMQTRLNELYAIQNGTYDGRGKTVNTDHQVIVTVMCENATQGYVKISYYTPQAGWASAYDLRGESASGNLQVLHKAQVVQATGVDWNNVALTLTSGNPQGNQQLPQLNPFYLSFYQNVYRHRADKKSETAKMYAGAAAPSTRANDREEDFPGEQNLQEVTLPADFTATTENMVRMDYDIKLKYTIPSDNKSHLVVIENKQVPVGLTYAAVPKLDQAAYLEARMGDWENLNLLDAEARIFLDGAYVGTSYLNTAETGDTLRISMGRESAIVIKRKKLKDKCKEKIIGDTKVIEQTYEITVHNTKASSIEMEVYDQIPLSNDNTIKIEAKDVSKGQYDEFTGKVTWKMKLKAKETRKMEITYTVTIPKTRQLAMIP